METGVHGRFNLQLKDSGTLLCLCNGSLISRAYVLVTLKILSRVYDELSEESSEVTLHTNYQGSQRHLLPSVIYSALKTSENIS